MEVSAAITPANTGKAGYPGKDGNAPKSAVFGDFAALLALAPGAHAAGPAPAAPGLLPADGNVAGKPAGNILPELAATDAEGAALLEGIPGMAAIEGIKGIEGIEGIERNASMAPLPSEVPAAQAPTIEMVLTAITMPAAISAHMAPAHAEPQAAPAPAPAAALAQVLQATVNARPQPPTRASDLPARSASRSSATERTGAPYAKHDAASPGLAEQPPGQAQATSALRAVPPASLPAGTLTTEPRLPAPAEDARSAGETPAASARRAADMPAKSAEAPAAQPLRAAITRTAELAADLGPGMAETIAMPAAVPAQAAGIAPATPAVTAPGTPSLAGPQDFQTLVDRLAEAREAASPKSVTAALSHAEFGRVSLVFRHDERALSVGMTSNDPGFAPAVQAAVASAAGAQGQQSQDSAGLPNRQDTQAQAGAQQQAAAGQGEARQQGAAQSRQQESSQPGNPAARPRDEASAAVAPDGATDSRRAGARGIYA